MLFLKIFSYLNSITYIYIFTMWNVGSLLGMKRGAEGYGGFYSA